jgi:hypothetical protein
MKKKQHGGRRKGAGRKKDTEYVQLHIYVSPQTASRLRAEVDSGDRSQFADRALAAALDSR